MNLSLENAYDVSAFPVDSYYPVAEHTKQGDEVLKICTQNEHTLIRAYSELLDESLPCQNLKDMMHCQLNALKNTFLKVKTLNSARFAL